MPLAATSSLGSALNCRLAVNGIQKASRSGRLRRSEMSFMRTAPLVLSGARHGCADGAKFATSAPWWARHSFAIADSRAFSGDSMAEPRNPRHSPLDARLGERIRGRRRELGL